jgi:pyrroline-5-carboxylate reductase
MPVTRKISFIGGGKITEILIANMTARAVVDPALITVSNPGKARLEDLQKRFGVNKASSNGDAAASGDIIFVCVRSEIASAVAEELGGMDFSGKTVVTISAGVPMKLYREKLKNASVVRVMPNPPSKIGYGAIAVSFDDRIDGKAREDVMEIFSSMGKCFVLPEEKINILTSITCPAPVFAFCSAIIQSSVLLGIDHATSEDLVFHTIQGCLKEWEHNPGQMAKLLTETSTPGGISVQQLFSLDKGGFGGVIKQTYVDGWAKSKEFGDRILNSLD